MQSAANLSSHKFPANREINREFCRIRPSIAIFVSDQRADSIAYSGIPYAMEQGIFKCVSANFFRGTGKFNPATTKLLKRAARLPSQTPILQYSFTWNQL